MSRDRYPADDDWRLDPALARIALGATRRRRGDEAPPSMATALHEAWDLDEAFDRDLDDPAQRAFGDYELLELIGRGGMGVVYRAREKRLDREVAIKLLSAGTNAPEGLVEVLRSEARHAARLQHPNIVAIYGMGEHDDLIYYAMQLVHGSTLSQRIDHDGPLPPRAAARLLRVVAEAVDYAHRFGVLHLDLKPGNLLLDGDTPLIADFGLARPLGQERAAEVSGTPGYMAPEQAAPDIAPLSPATDVWALGAILHEMLTGRPPFPAGTAEQAVDLVLHAPAPAPSRLAAAVPPDLDAICLCCLEKDPARRYPDARALADDLGRFLEGRQVSVHALGPWQRLVRWTRREPKLALASSALLLALVLGLSATATQWWRAEANAASARLQSWNTRGDAAWRAIETGQSTAARDLLLANLAERERHGDLDGATLERLRLGSLRYLMPELIDAIATGEPGHAIAIDGPGTRVAVSVGNEELRMYHAGDGRELWRTRIHDASHFWPSGVLERVAFTRDGRRLIADRGEPATVTRPAGHDNILVDAADGRPMLPPADRFPDFRDATYSADGRYAILRNTARQAQLFRVDGWESISPRRRFGNINGMWRLGDGARFIALTDGDGLELWDPRTLQTRFVLAIDRGIPLLAWDAQPDGALLALGYDDGRVRLLDCDTLALRDLRPAPSQRIEWIAFSADGRWLTATTLDRAFVWDVASGRGTALPARGATAFRFVEIDAGSGTVFAFGHNESGLWRLPATDDDRDAARIVDTNAQALRVHFPPRAAIPFQAIATRPALRLAASLDVDGELRIWRWREQNTLQERATAFAAHGQHFDGRHVAVAQGRVARVLAIDDSHAASPDMLHPQPVSLAALAPDGRTLVTLSGRQLRAFDWRTGRPRFAPVVLDATPLRVALSPDARIVLTGIGAYRDGRFHELLSTHDLDGRTLADGVAVPGPVAGLRFDADGRRLLLWRRRELWLHDAATLDRIGAQATVLPDTLVPAAGDRPRLQTPQASAGVQDAFLADGSDAATVITRASAYASARVADVDLSTGSILHERDLGKASAMSLLESADGLEILASQPGHPYRIDAAGRNRTLASPSGQDLMLPSAVGGDGRWLATTTASGIVLTDRRHDQWASAPLPVVLPADDALVELWFSPGASRLLARSHRGRWLWWSLDPESRPADRVSGDGAPAPAVTHAAPAAAAPAVSARAVLRARDPGAGIAAPPPHETPQQHVPQPAAATAGFAFIDLGPAINRRADTPYMVFNDSLALYTSVPAGTQRYLGIDFDIRGVVAMSMRGGGAPRGIARNLGWRSAPWRSAPVPVPVVDVEAVHLLLGACCMLQGLPAGGLYGHVVFEYVDGTEARMPIRYHLDLREPWNDPGDALPARIAWVETSPRSDVDMDLPFRLYAARFANPHPARAVARLRFEASDLAWAGPLVFAATLETARDDKPIAQRP